MPFIPIQFTPVYCKILSIPPNLDQILYDKLSYRPEGFMFSPRYLKNQWDGYTHLYSMKTKKFGSGLLDRVKEILGEYGYTVSVSGFPKPKPFIQRSDTYTLRPHQLRVAKDICEKRFGIVNIPIRGGKTLIAIAVFDSEREFPAVMLVRSKELLYQTQKRMQQFLPSVSCGIVGDGHCDIKDVTIVTVQTAFSAYNEKPEERFGSEAPIESEQDKQAIRNLLETCKILFQDETHHAHARTNAWITSRARSVTMRIGLSGTPFSGDEAADMKRERSMGSIISEVSWQELIDAGYLLAPSVFLYKLPKTPSVTKRDTYSQVYKKAISENEYLLKVLRHLVNKITSKQKSVVVHVDKIKHAELISKYLNVPKLIGEDTTERRKEILSKLEQKEILAVVSDLFKEGVDIASLDYVINAAGGKSLILATQRMRSLTAHEGKQVGGVIDFIFQDEYLRRHSKARKRVYNSIPGAKIREYDLSNLSIEDIPE